MARPGPAPKDPAQRVRRNKDSNQSFSLSSNGDLIGPELPSDREWCPATIEYFDTWRRSPNARAFEVTDWLVLLRCARMHHILETSSRYSSMLASELRQCESRLGATIEDRQKLRMNIAHGEELAPDNAAQLTDWASKYVPKADN